MLRLYKKANIKVLEPQIQDEGSVKYTQGKAKDSIKIAVIWVSDNAISEHFTTGVSRYLIKVTIVKQDRNAVNPHIAIKKTPEIL